jgi:hypothetical protein
MVIIAAKQTRIFCINIVHSCSIIDVAFSRLKPSETGRTHDRATIVIFSRDA